MRIIIYTGKGGVGKTSISAATACRLAHNGKKVLIMSTDLAHSLSDSFGVKLGSEPVVIFENLEAMEIDTIHESQRAWRHLHDYLKQIITEKANGGIATDEALLFPGFDELFSLLRILSAYEQNKHDVIIVDCAPTGETLALLCYAEKLSVFADTIVPLVRNINSAVGSLISKKTTVPKPQDAVFDEFAYLVTRLSQLQTILRDRSITTMRLVTTPERVVLEETRRSYTWLQLYDFGVDAVFINKIYPAQALKGYFAHWKSIQDAHIRLVHESFSNQRIFTLQLSEQELQGTVRLCEAAQELYGQIDPVEVFCTETAFHLEEEHGTRFFIIHLPFISPHEIAVVKEGTDLIVSVRSETRRFHLPENINRRKLSGYEYKDGQLRISFDY
ncbi:MAG: ArsA family ATPase [Treponema sp.]